MSELTVHSGPSILHKAANQNPCCFSRLDTYQSPQAALPQVDIAAFFNYIRSLSAATLSVANHALAEA